MMYLNSSTEYPKDPPQYGICEEGGKLFNHFHRGIYAQL
jgi:hypothetical protein